MHDLPCADPLGTHQLLAYWLGELDECDGAVEQHLFSCAACTASLERIVAFGEGIRQQFRHGEIGAMLPASFVQRLQASGLRLREYRLEPGTSVNCTVAPDDDLVLSHLQAPLAGVRRLDAVFEDIDAGAQARLVDLGFNESDGEIVFLPKVCDLRPVERATYRIRLIAADEDSERTLGMYTFHHRASG